MTRKTIRNNSLHSDHIAYILEVIKGTTIEKLLQIDDEESKCAADTAESFANINELVNSLNEDAELLKAGR